MSLTVGLLAEHTIKNGCLLVIRSISFRALLFNLYTWPERRDIMQPTNTNVKWLSFPEE